MAAEAGASQPGTVAGDGGRGRLRRLRRLRLGAAAWHSPGAGHDVHTVPGLLVPMAGRGPQPRRAALGITWPLSFFIAASSARAQGAPVTQVPYTAGQDCPGMGRLGTPGEAGCPHPAGITRGEGDTGGAPGPGQPPALLLQLLAPTRAGAVGEQTVRVVGCLCAPLVTGQMVPGEASVGGCVGSPCPQPLCRAPRLPLTQPAAV